MKNLSIIICTHNRSELVKDLVLSFNGYEGITPETEIIVIANACSDDTVSTLDSIKDQLQAQLIVKELKEPGLSLARNAGLEAASHDIIAFLDDDIRLFPGWAAGFHDAFANHDCDIVGGCIKLWWHKTEEPDWLHFYHKRLLGFNDHGDDIKPIAFGNIFGGNFAIKRTVYETIGGFSTTFGRKGQERLAGEEAEYFLNAQDAGFKFLYTPKASVEHLVNEERASIEYLTQSALGVGTSRILLPNQINTINTDLILKKIELLLEETNKEIASQNSVSDSMLHKTRRFDLLGETIGTLKYMFGDIDLSAKTILEYPLALNIISSDKNAAPKPAVPVSPSSPDHTYLISVIIPCFNAAELIKPCLDALVKQTLNQDLFEVICIDDCSTDKTIKTIKSYDGKIKNLVIFEHKENKKQGAARNTGLKNAKGEYITFVDADDFLDGKALEVLISNTNGKDLLVAQHQFIYPNDVHKNRLSKRVIQNNAGLSALKGLTGWWPVGMLISRSLINDNMIKFREDVFFEDIDFVIGIALAAKSFEVINDVVYQYLQHPGSTINKLNRKKLDDSASAITHVFHNLINRNNHTEYQSWVTASKKWLLYQFERIDLQNKTQEKKCELIEHYVIALIANRLFTLLGQDFKYDVVNKVLMILDLEILPKGHGEQQYINLISELTDLNINSISLLISDEPKNLPYLDNVKEILALSEEKVDSKLENKNEVLLKKSYNLKHIDFLLIPHNHYHGHNLGRIAVELSKQGLTCKLLKMAPPHPDEGAFIEEYKESYISLSDVLFCEVLPAAIVVMNDWENNVASKLIAWANTKNIETYAIVEGVNDYHDIDTGKKRKAYQRVKNLFLNGDFDSKYFTDIKQRIEVVGIDRLDTLYERVKNMDKVKKIRKAVINLNFTYGVLEEHAEQWLKDVISACEGHSLEFTISKHLADKVKTKNNPVTERPLYDELIENEIFITRFSGAVFEALIAGCKVIYYNPGIEKIDKFTEPLGAYLYASCKSELLTAINKIKNNWNPKPDEFLQLHTSESYHVNSYASLDTSLLKTTRLLILDNKKNKKNSEFLKGHYFDKGFSKIQELGWAWQYYPVLIKPRNLSLNDVLSKNTRQIKELTPVQNLGCLVFQVLFKPFITLQYQKKLKNTPVVFFQDSKHPVSRFYGKLFRII